VNLVVPQQDLLRLVPLHIPIALFPALLWFLFSRLPEARAALPRTALASTFWIAALGANGVALPFTTNFLQLDQWLPSADPLTKIIGYTVSLGIVQELSKYMVVYALAWDSRLRERTDAVAYSVAAAMGYATAVNIVQALTNPATPPFASFDTFSTVALNVAPSLLVAYGIAEARIGRASAFLMPTLFALAALLFGVLMTLRGLLTNAELTLVGRAQISQPNPLIDVALVAGIVFLTAFAVAFLMSNAERREAEAGMRR
jgi:RsiW-degrading membrane proteinase PrsW (M82 family)